MYHIVYHITYSSKGLPQTQMSLQRRLFGVQAAHPKAHQVQLVFNLDCVETEVNNRPNPEILDSSRWDARTVSTPRVHLQLWDTSSHKLR